MISFKQLRLSEQSLRITERPWLKIKSKVNVEEIAENVPLAGIVEFTNMGKTVAKNLSMEIVMQVTPNGQAPDFSYERPALRNTMGSMFPDDPLPLYVTPYVETKASGFQPLNLSHYDLGELKAGRAYIMIYARVIYYDIFGVKYSTRSCGWKSIAPDAPAGYTARQCVAYNGVDDSHN